MAQRTQLPEISARLSPTNKPSYHQQAVQAERVAKAIRVPQSSRTGDMSPGMRETLNNLGTGGQAAGKAMNLITKGVSQASMTQYQKRLKGNVDKMNDIAGKLGENQNKMADSKGKMDALTTAMNSLQSLGCAAKDELDKLQADYDAAKQDYDNAQKNMTKASDQLNRAEQDLQNQMNKSYPNTRQGRQQKFQDDRAAIQNRNQAEYNQSVAQGEMERTGYNSNQAANLRNQSLESFGELQGKVQGTAGEMQGVQDQARQEQADYLNNVRDLQGQQREFAQTSRDMFDTAMNQARIAQGGSTLEAVGSMAKDAANGEYWSAGGKAVNTTLDWARLSGTTGAATPLLPWAQNVITATTQAADRGANAWGVAEAAMDATFGYTNLNASWELQGKAFDALAQGNFADAVSYGMQSAYPASQALGITAQNFLSATPFAAATPIARPTLEAAGQGIASLGRSTSMVDLYLNADRMGNAMTEVGVAPVTAFMSGVGQFAETLTGVDGLQERMEGYGRDISKTLGDATQKNIVDDLFKQPPNTSEQLRLDNDLKKKTGNPLNTKNPKSSNPKSSNNNCPKPIKPRPADPSQSGTGLGVPYQ